MRQNTDIRVMYGRKEVKKGGLEDKFTCVERDSDEKRVVGCDHSGVGPILLKADVVPARRRRERRRDERQFERRFRKPEEPGFFKAGVDVGGQVGLGGSRLKVAMVAKAGLAFRAS